MSVRTLRTLDRTSTNLRADINALFTGELNLWTGDINALAATVTTLVAGGAYALPYNFSSNVGDPGLSAMRLDNFAVQTSASTLRISVTGADLANHSGELDLFDQSSSAVKGRGRLQKVGNTTAWLTFDVTARTSSGIYRDLAITNVQGSSAAPFANGDSVLLFYQLTGDKGQAGVDGTPRFGDGSDGDVTISSGTTTLTRNMYYHNLTINGTGSIAAAGYQIFVSGTLDIGNAPAGAIKRTVQSGGAAAADVAGAAATAHAEVMAGGAGQGLIGKTGATSGNVGTASTQAVKTNIMQGGLSGKTSAAGNGDAGGTHNGGAGVAKPATVASMVSLPLHSFALSLFNTLAQGGVGGAGGPSGGAGGGGAKGGGGGGGGSGGGVLDIRANIINRGASTAASAIQSLGGDGGKGGDGTIAGGGGSGGAGGGGGMVQIAYRTLTGATATNCIDVSGGKGGDAGAGVGTGSTAGSGADGGDGGRVRVYDTTAGTVVDNVSAATGSAGVTTVGGAGAVAKYNL